MEFLQRTIRPHYLKDYTNGTDCCASPYSQLLPVNKLHLLHLANQQQTISLIHFTPTQKTLK